MTLQDLFNQVQKAFDEGASPDMKVLVIDKSAAGFYPSEVIGGVWTFTDPVDDKAQLVPEAPSKFFVIAHPESGNVVVTKEEI